MSQNNLTVFTAADDVRTRLKTSVQVLFTLTPTDTPSSPNLYPAIAWKIFPFQKSGVAQQTLTWGEDFGFTVIEQQEDGTISPSHLSVPVNLKCMATLGITNGLPHFIQPPRKIFDAPVIGVFNKTNAPQHLALCSVDNSDKEGMKFCPVVDIGVANPQQTIKCGPPVILQAYAVSGYKEGQILEPADLSHPLFVNHAGDPLPKDIRRLKSGETFCLYTNDLGEIVLKEGTPASPREKSAVQLENLKPAVKQKTPTAEQEKPAVEQEEPVAEQETPAIEREEPALEQETPAVEQERPAVEPENPGVEQEKPAVEREGPAVEQGTPAVSDRHHVGGLPTSDTTELANPRRNILSSCLAAVSGCFVCHKA